MIDFAKWVMIIGWIFVLIWIPFIIYTNKKVHPKALFILFFAEMWERFSYYGMRTLLTLYMVKVLFVELGEAAADKRALGIYGSYTAMVYLFPVVGGLIADRIFGFKKAIVFGGILMMLGHFALALEGMFFPGHLFLFFLSLSLIIIGNGLFKPNISSFLGEFYGANDPRKDGGFTIFYMGVNIGAFLSILTCGYVGENIDWHYGFGLAGIGMFLGLVVFMVLGPGAFGDKGGEPKAVKSASGTSMSLKTQQLLTIVATIAIVPLSALLLDLSDVMTWVLLIISVGILGVLVTQALTMEDKKAGKRLLVIAVLFVFHAVFWALFEQAGGSITLFTDRHVDREIFGSEIPASMFQFFNSLFIILLAPLFSVIWKKLNEKEKEPSTPMKFVLGLTFLALGFLVVVLGAELFAVAGIMPVIFIILMYLLHTIGELSLSPVGLSMITKLSPKKIMGFVMGAWFLSIALANKMAGLIGELTTIDVPDAAEQVKMTHAESMSVYLATYQTWGVAVVLGFALVLFFLVPTLRKWMGGIN